jgi:hypothetical protein
MFLLNLFLLGWIFRVSALPNFLNAGNASQHIFKYSAEVNLRRLATITFFAEHAYKEAIPDIKANKADEISTIRDFWVDNFGDYRFLLESAHSIVQSMIHTTQTELDLALSDPEILEDMMEINVDEVSQLVFQSSPTIQDRILRNPDVRQRLQIFFTEAYQLPLSNRFIDLVMARKWNSTCVFSNFY